MEQCIFIISAADIEQLKCFSCGGYCDDSTIVYLQHPCTILTALEVLGYKVVASSSTAVKQDYNEYMWTMRKDFSEPEPDETVGASAIKPGWYYIFLGVCFLCARIISII